MPASQPEREIKNILRFALFSIGVAIALAIALILVVPFDVSLKADFDRIDGVFYLRDSVGNERRVVDVESFAIDAGETIRLNEGTTGRLEIIEGSAAYAYVYDMAIWELTSATRNGTAWQHISDPSGNEFEIIIEQRAGVVVYDFSQADPNLDTLNVTLRFADDEVSPEFDCFQATAPTEDAASAIAEIPCWGDSPQFDSR